MKPSLPLLCLCLLLGASLPAAANWKPTERIETYPVSGQSGIELYRAIGEKGPKVGVGRAIATTTFDLKWSRNYVPENGGCTLKSVKPFLVIITRLPKATGKLPPELKARWETFRAGIEAHERVHAEIILDMVRAIEAFSVGLNEPEDPDCKKIRKTLSARLVELSQAQRARSREFDRVELGEGGAVHRMILALVNG